MDPQAAGQQRRREGNPRDIGQQTHNQATVIRSSNQVRGSMPEESWIEVSSRPSSSSLSSAATDEVVTTGLRVGQESQPRRRRRLHRPVAAQHKTEVPGHATGNNSSQEEYEDSESESDRVMTSSNEDFPQGFRTEVQQQGTSPRISLGSGNSEVASVNSAEDEGEEDDDENATALGVVDPTPFTPQPHAFSHPPSTRPATHTPASQDSYFPPTFAPSNNTASRPASAIPATSTNPSIRSRAHVRTRSHTPYNIIAPNHSVAVDHDAALRASLSTLLSCAAAARGLQKRESPLPSSTATQSRPIQPLQRSRQHSRVEPSTLRILPESALARVEENHAPPALPRRPPNTSPHSTDSPGSPVPPTSSPATAKRKAKSPVRDKRGKKYRSGSFAASEDLVGTGVSPTLTTWVVGAGVLVLFSAISFSAGYALGREVGRVDALGTGAGAGAGAGAGGAAGLGCAGEAEGMLGRGIVKSRGWRWGNGSGVRV